MTTCCYTISINKERSKGVHPMFLTD